MMDLRITPQIIAAEAIANAQQQTSQLAFLQQEASTGLRILQPSDNPTAALAVMGDQAQNNQLSVYHQNISDAQAKLNGSVSTLNQITNLLTQAKDLGLQGSNQPNTPSAYQAMGAQVDSILKEVIQLANTQQNGQYLYGGTASQAQPFTTNAQGQVVYNGSDQSMSEPIGQGLQVQTLYNGSQIFQSPDVFQTLSGLRDALNNVNNLSPSAQVAAIQQSLSQLDSANTSILNVVGKQSASLQNLQSIDSHIQDVQLQTTQQIGNLQNADLSQVVIGLQEQQNLLQATLYSAKSVMSLNMLNFIGMP
jgi:flagellar hook-associated protein 3 FlgL